MEDINRAEDDGMGMAPGATPSRTPEEIVAAIMKEANEIVGLPGYGSDAGLMLLSYRRLGDGNLEIGMSGGASPIGIAKAAATYFAQQFGLPLELFMLMGGLSLVHQQLRNEAGIGDEDGDEEGIVIDGEATRTFEN